MLIARVNTSYLRLFKKIGITDSDRVYEYSVWKCYFLLQFAIVFCMLIKTRLLWLFATLLPSQWLTALRCRPGFNTHWHGMEVNMVCVMCQSSLLCHASGKSVKLINSFLPRRASITDAWQSSHTQLSKHVQLVTHRHAGQNKMRALTWRESTKENAYLHD